MGGPQRAGKAPAPSAGRGAEPQGGWPGSGPPRPSAEPSSAPLPRGRPRKPRVPPRVRQVPGSPVGPVWRLGLSGVCRCSGGRAAALGSGAAWAVGPGPGREDDSPCAGSGTAGRPGLAGWACGLAYTGNSGKSKQTSGNHYISMINLSCCEENTTLPPRIFENKVDELRSAGTQLGILPL